MVLARADERQVWVRVVDSNGNETEFIDNIISASFTRVLDGMGSFGLQVVGTDGHALDNLTTGTKVNIYVFERNMKRLIGSGIIRSLRASDSSNNFTVTLTGPDELDDLRRKSVLLRLSYDNETIDDMVNGDTGLQGLLDFVNGWTASVSTSSSHYARFDGLSVLKAIQEIVEAKGTHFRLGSANQTIEIGDFGTSNGLTLLQAPIYTPDIDSNDDIGIIASIKVNEDADDVVDFIVPLGASSGSDITLTLEDSTRTSPYTIQSDTYNGVSYYYLGTSTKTLSQVFADNTLTIKTLVFDQIQIHSNSATDIQTAANALYDIASAYLDRHSTSLTEYDIVARKLRSNVLPGDKIRLMYKGFIEDANTGELMPPRDINSELWVMSVTENMSTDGLMTSLKLATVDRVMMDEARIIVGELERVRIRNLSVKPYPNTWAYTYTREMDSSNSAIVPLRITNRVLRAREVTVRIKTTPFRTLASGAAGGGDHRHKMFAFGFGTAVPSANRNYFAYADDGLNSVTIGLYANPGSNTEIWTHDSSGDHTHPLNYAINDDTSYPVGVTIKINGTDRTTALGGSWGAGGSITEVLDITQYITGAATLYQTHEIEFGCASGQGRIEVSIEIVADTQTLAVT